MLARDAESLFWTGRYLERLGQSVLVQSPQHKEGMQAFFEKRAPKFSGG